MTAIIIVAIFIALSLLSSIGVGPIFNWCERAICRLFGRETKAYLRWKDGK